MITRKKFLLAACLAGFGVLVWQLSTVPEPVYQGKPLTFWIGGDDPDEPHGLLSQVEDKEAGFAIRAMGRSCVPHLTRMISAQAPDPELPNKWTSLPKMFRRYLEKKFEVRYSRIFHRR